MEEHRCHELGCTCGYGTRAELPPDVTQTSSVLEFATVQGVHP